MNSFRSQELLEFKEINAGFLPGCKLFLRALFYVYVCIYIYNVVFKYPVEI